MAVNNTLNSSDSSSTNLRGAECECEDNFIEHCIVNCISHSQCPREWVCDLCSVRTKDNKSLQMHICSQKHTERQRQLMDHVLLVNMPLPTQFHIEKIIDIIMDVNNKWSLNLVQYNQRKGIEYDLNILLKHKSLPKCSVRLYGSSIGGYALQNSDVNFELIVDQLDLKNDESAATILSRISKILDKEKRFSNVINEFNIRVPRVLFRDRNARVNCEISITSELSYRLSRLFAQYMSIDERARLLTIALRKWSNIFELDNQESCTWPSHSFTIMVIHYLQQCQPPVLPCLNEIFPKEKKPDDDENNVPDDCEYDLTLLSEKWKCFNRQNVGELWLSMFRYYSVNFDLENDVISIRHTNKPETHESKHWGTRLLAIEDPFRPSLNLSRSVGSMKIYQLFVQMLRYTYRYFSIPFVKSIDNGIIQAKPLFSNADFSIIIDPLYYVNRSPVNDLISCLNQINIDYTDNDKLHKLHNNCEDSDSDGDNNQKKDQMWKTYNNFKRLLRIYGIRLILDIEMIKKISMTPKDGYLYTFDFRSLPFYQKPPRFCRLCHKHGHSQNKCPVEVLPQLAQIPNTLIPFQKDILDSVCSKLYNGTKLTPQDEQIHSYVIEDLQCFIRNADSKVQLELFGSTKNGFGARNCDLDICLTFQGNQKGENLDHAAIVEDVAQLLLRHNYVTDVIPITSAKVPIVKFKYSLHPRNSIECDISSYNLLARYNTTLLRTYCEIDERVSELGFTVKHFAKSCDICDASRGSLSSYAYTLMTLHYLQQRKVIPVLQEFGAEKKFERIIDSWDTWFNDDLEYIRKYWGKQCHESVGELFVGFLRYYSETFNFVEDVVCCRQFAPLKRIDKMWTTRKIAIEDPFLLSHNLGAGVDDQMAIFIKTTLIRGRNFIGNLPNVIPEDYHLRISFIFDKRQNTSGRLPTGHGCLSCGKIGHKIADCPTRRKNDRRRNNRGVRDRDMNTDKGRHFEPKRQNKIKYNT